MAIHLTNKQLIKEYSPLPLNYNMEEIETGLYATEKIWIVPLIGEEQYEELLEQIEEGTSAITPSNQTLLLEIQPFLCYALCYEMLPVIAYHFSEVGITKGKSENSDSIDLKDTNYLQQWLKQRVVYLQKQFIDFLKAYGGNYPLIPATNVDACSCKIRDEEKGVPMIYGMKKCTKKIQ